jgi:LMBR1 domain-containing protein 1
MALSPFLLIAIIVCSILFAVLVIFLMIYYGHPDDWSTAKLPKLIVLFGLWLAFSSMMILPYDVANQQGEGGLHVDVLWYIGFVCIAVMVSAVLPFAFFYYDYDEEDGEEGKGGSALGAAFKGLFLCATVFFVLCGIMFVFLGTAELPVYRIAYNANRVFSYNVTLTAIEAEFPAGGPNNPNGCGSPSATNCVAGGITWSVPVTFPIYIIALLSFIGWFAFVIFFSVGLVALPLDLINDFRTRPTPWPAEKYNEVRQDLGNRAKKLLEAGLMLQKEGRDLKGRGGSGSATRRHAQQLRNFEQSYYLLKKDYDVMKISWDLKGGNPLFYYAEGFLGIVGAGISVSWWLQVIIFILPARPINPFLNNLFLDLEVAGFNVFSIVAYACYAEWLMWCSLKGNFKLGVRFGIVKIFPMEVGNTFMNAFIFNTWILLLVVAPAIQFCVEAFPIYSAGSDIDIVFGDQVKYLQFFKYFYVYDIFEFAIVILAGLAAIYLFVFPNDRAKEIDRKIKAVAASDRDRD